MDICLLKGAARPHYLFQNLQILRMSEGEEISLSYRAKWVDEELLGPESLKGCEATIVFCDKPDYHVIPARLAIISYSMQSIDTLTLRVRCGPFVDPAAADDWRHQFRELYDKAGTENGHFVISLDKLGSCASAAPGRAQEGAWKWVVQQLSQVQRYKQCYFFHARQLCNATGDPASPRKLRVGQTYAFEVLSFNKHIDHVTLSNSALHVAVDEGVLRGEIQALGDKRVPGYGQFTVELTPVQIGSTTLEICVLGGYDDTSRVHLHCDVVEATDSQPVTIAPQGDQYAAKWRFYRVTQNLRMRGLEGDKLLVALLQELFESRELLRAEVAEEMVVRYTATGDYRHCAELTFRLEPGTVAAMRMEIRQELLLAVCRTRFSVDDVPALWNTDFGDKDFWNRLQAAVRALASEHASRLILSMIDAQRNAGLNMDEGLLGELLQLDNVRDGYTRPDNIQTVSDWLLGEFLFDDCAKFLKNRFGKLPELKASVQLLQNAVQACDGAGDAGVWEFLGELIEQLSSAGRGKDALDAIVLYSRYIPLEERPHLMAVAAETVGDASLESTTYTEAAEYCRRCADWFGALQYSERAIARAEDCTDNTALECAREERRNILDAITEAGESLECIQGYLELAQERLGKLYPNIRFDGKAYQQILKLPSSKLYDLEFELAAFQHNPSQYRFRDSVKTISEANVREIRFSGDSRAYITVEQDVMTVFRIGNKTTQTNDMKLVRGQIKQQE